jgi:hypothetical protein
MPYERTFLLPNQGEHAMRTIPAHIIEAAKRLANEAPAFTAEQLATAYRSLNITANAETSEELAA